MLRTWLKPVKRARSCRPSSDSRTGFVVVYRARAGLDANGDDGMIRHESRRTPPLMGKTPFPLPARALPLSPVRLPIPDPESQLARNSPDDCGRGISAGWFLISNSLVYHRTARPSE